MESEEKNAACPYQRCECPFPESMQTQTRPRYSEIYSTGSDIPGCRWNDVYSRLNYHDPVATQKMVTDQRVAGLPVPMFSYETPDAKRKFALCSYRAMIEHLRATPLRHWYSMTPDDVPLHFFCDFDLSADEISADQIGKRSVHGAMAEFRACFEHCMARLRVSEPSWANFGGDYTVSILYGHKNGKQSSHLVVHLGGTHMFADHRMCKSMYAMIIAESLTRHPKIESNPMFFFDTRRDDWVCILDHAIYTPFRNFRTVASYKNKADRSKIAGGLYPRCATWDDLAPGSGCSDAGCFYHAQHCFLDSDFLANDPTFIPRMSSGAPAVPVLLNVPFSDNPMLKRNRKRPLATEASKVALLPAAFNNSRSVSSASLSTLSLLSTTTASNAPMDDSEVTLRRRCLEAAARLIASVEGGICSVGRSALEIANDDCDTGLVSSTMQTCHYACKLKNPKHNTPEFHDIHVHRSNHTCYLVTIDLPLPRVSHRCSDPDCRKLIDKLKRPEDRQALGYDYISCDVSHAPEELRMRYGAAARAYMLASEIPEFMLE